MRQRIYLHRANEQWKSGTRHKSIEFDELVNDYLLKKQRQDKQFFFLNLTLFPTKPFLAIASSSGNR